MWVKRCRLTRVGHSIPMHYDTQHLPSAGLARADNKLVSISLIGHNLQLVSWLPVVRQSLYMLYRPILGNG